MLQDLKGFIYDDTFTIIHPEKDDFIVYLRQNKVLLDEDYCLPKYNDSFNGHSFVYLFRINDYKFFYCFDDIDEYNEYSYKSFNNKTRTKEKWMNFAIATGMHFADWYRDNKYCGRCGKENKLSTKERMIYCEDCKTMIFPKICPAVIVAVIDKQNDRIIVTRRSKQSANNSLVSGFCEIGETLETTCAREVFEEVGVHIKNLQYYKSQPWSFSNTLLMGFYCELDGDDTLNVDYNENVDAFWIKREDMELRNDDFSLTAEMLDEFCKGNIK